MNDFCSQQKPQMIDGFVDSVLTIILSWLLLAELDHSAIFRVSQNCFTQTLTSKGVFFTTLKHYPTAKKG